MLENFPYPYVVVAWKDVGIKYGFDTKNYLCKMRFHDFVPLNFNFHDFNKVDVSMNILDFASDS